MYHFYLTELCIDQVLVPSIDQDQGVDSLPASCQSEVKYAFCQN